MGIGEVMRIIAIYDNGGKTWDRYTVITDEKWSAGLVAALGLSERPEDYNGFSQWTGAQNGSHLGQRTQFESLTARLQAHIAARVFGGDDTLTATDSGNNIAEPRL